MGIEELEITLAMLNVKYFFSVDRNYIILDLFENKDLIHIIINLIKKYNFSYMLNEYDSLCIYIGDKNNEIR